MWKWWLKSKLQHVNNDFTSPVLKLKVIFMMCSILNFQFQENNNSTFVSYIIGKAPNEPLQTNTLHAIRLRTSYELQKINMHIFYVHTPLIKKL